MSDDLFDVGVIGLGVMGRNLALNLVDHGFRVKGYDRSGDAGDVFLAEAESASAGTATSLTELVAGLERPRRIIMLVDAGPTVDVVLDELGPLLEADDIVVDGGNSLYRETDARLARFALAPGELVGMGVSGGAEGARRGPSLMPGGSDEAWDRLRPLLERIAARGAGGPCVTHCGRGSAGHFVKMVHNGIEYGDMQLIAETVTLLRRGLDLSGAEVANVLDAWNGTELESFLIEITGRIFHVADPDGSEGLLVDQILDAAGQKGTGRWTVMAAADMGVAIPTIAAAVDARVLSAQPALRSEGESTFGRPSAGLSDVRIDDLRSALYAAKLASYSQGFELLARGSEEKNYGIDRAEVARIWTAGCIIRAGLLKQVREAFEQAPDVGPLVLTPQFVPELTSRMAAWRRVVSAATGAGIAIPALAASLTWFDTLTTARGSANILQAQRDYFGSHTYRRVDRPDEVIHTDWASVADDPA